MKEKVSIRLWILTVLILSIPTAFFCGMAISNSGENDYEIRQAILSGKSHTLDNFVITPDKQWTKKRPVNYISLREKAGWTIAGAGDNTLQSGAIEGK